MASSTAKYQPLATSPEEEEEEEDNLDASNGSNTVVYHGPSTSRTLSPNPTSLFAGLLGRGQSGDRSLSVSPSIPVTPHSSDGVFSNIPAKPTSSRDIDEEEEEMGEDEWIFMTPEQRQKLPPPKYSKIKRDRAPKYTFDYNPPDLGRNNRPTRYKPRINSLPAGSTSLFIATTVISTLLPILGFCVLYLSNGAKWKSHASRLGSRTGVGLSLFHIGIMLFYIPALLLSSSYGPAIVSLLWTFCVGIPCGWRIARASSKEFSWVKAQERVLIDRFKKANLAVDDGRYGENDDDDNDNGFTYIHGTDMRVRDLKHILSHARDARLARSLRAAGF
ncbi:hypothetical protein Clacol_005248 [Clathrus columnatus]|uniref:Uncharacterized protein n=1 Tax=Clathrus columnatus TaxID=1419009 RepID=A0AAV5AE77_9AGAM|nr:hypothetical protein Clacol_005248 [Clathrus columnatus]